MKMSYKTIGLSIFTGLVTIIGFVANLALNSSMMNDMTIIRDGGKLDTETEED